MRCKTVRQSDAGTAASPVAPTSWQTLPSDSGQGQCKPGDGDRSADALENRQAPWLSSPDGDFERRSASHRRHPTGTNRCSTENVITLPKPAQGSKCRQSIETPPQCPDISARPPAMGGPCRCHGTTRSRSKPWYNNTCQHRSRLCPHRHFGYNPVDRWTARSQFGLTECKVTRVDPSIAAATRFNPDWQNIYVNRAVSFRHLTSPTGAPSIPIILQTAFDGYRDPGMASHDRRATLSQPKQAAARLHV